MHGRRLPGTCSIMVHHDPQGFADAAPAANDRPTGLSPVLVVFAGPNGSGKTTLPRAMLQSGWLDGFEYLNPEHHALPSSLANRKCCSAQSPRRRG